MRIWDIDAGFLNDRSLLGEHRELHGIVSIIRNKKNGYSRHPETLRWVNYLRSLIVRHGLLVAEMKLRGFNHDSPIEDESGTHAWPEAFIDEPERQYAILRGKYIDRKGGRIPLPGNSQELWAYHKYSVMARNLQRYREIGTGVADGTICFSELSRELVSLLRIAPPKERCNNALQHMWGYVSDFSEEGFKENNAAIQLDKIACLSKKHEIRYLLQSTALGELRYWCQY